MTGGNTGGAFQIDSSTGAITVADTNDVDFETNHPFSLTVEATDNGTPNQSGSNTVTVNLTNVNEAPVITAPATVNAQYQVAKPISGISVADPDAGSNDVAMTLGVLDGTLSLDTSVANGLVAGDVTGNGTDALSIAGTLTEINNTLSAANGLTYTSDAGFSGLSDTLTIAVDDNGNTGSGTPQTDTEDVTIQFSTPPVATAQTVSTNEDTEKSITLTGTDGDGDPLTFKITSLPANGGKLHEGTSSAGTEITTVPHTLPADKVTYVPPLDGNGTGFETFDFKVNDGSADSAAATVTLDVTAINDAPNLGITGGNLAYSENDPATAITSNVTLSDVDSPMLTGATVQITGNYQNGQDVLAYPGGFSITASPFDTGTGTLTLSGTTTVANYLQALEAVTYENTSHNPSELTRTVTFTATDGALSDTATTGIDVTEINDVPVLTTPGGDLAYTENDAATAIHSTMTVTDADHTNASGATVQITGNYQNGQDVLSFVNAFGITAAPFDASTGTLTLSGNTTFANYQSALQTVKYHNTSENPSALTRTVTFTVNDGEGNGTDTHGIEVTPVNDAPVADLDTLNGNKSALANTTLDNGVNSAEAIHIDTASNENVLTGDFDHEGDTISLIAGADCTGASAPFNCTTDQSGTVTLHANGLFEYQPPAGYTGTDSFDYRVSDGQPQNAESNGTVNINVTGPVVWYVDGSAGAGGTGTSYSKLQGLAPLSTGGGSDSKDGAGDIIFVHSGNYANGIVLENTQKLIGHANSLDVTDNVGRTHTDLVAAGGTPAISHAGQTVVTLGSGNTLEDVALGNGTIALAGTTVGTATVNDSSINTTGKALDVNGGNLAMTFTNVSSSSSPTEAIKLNNVTGSFTAPAGTLQNATNAVVDINDAVQDFTYGGNISDTSGPVVSITNTDGGTKDFNGTISGSNGGTNARISLTSNTGSVIRFDNDLALNTQGLAAFNATGGGTVHVTSDDNVLTTTTGRPLVVVNTTIGAGDLIFDSISSNGAANGIVLDNTGSTGNLAVTGTSAADGNDGGTIANTTGADAATNQCASPAGQPSGVGIFLRSTAAPSIDDMLINGSSNFGILGYSVNGFSMSSTNLTGTHGTNDAQNEGTVMFCGLTGSASVTDSQVLGGYENSFTVSNTSGTLNPLTVSNTDFATSTGGLADDAFNASAFNSAVMNVTVNNDSAFTTAGGDLLNYVLNNSAAGTLTLNGNDFTNNHPSIVSGGGGITVAAGGGGSNTDLNYTITDNDMRDALGNGLTITTGVGNGAGDYDGTISNNRIGVAGEANSGSAQADGLAFNHEGSGTHTASITNNTIVQYANGYGIGLRPQGTTGSPMRVTIKGNTISNPGTFALAGIGVDIASTSTTLCLDIGGAGGDANSIATSNGAGFDDINILTNAASNTINLPGYVGGAKDATAVQTFLASRNAGNGVATVFADTTGSFGNGGANCL
ncbi:MAG: beta strand repeat-containing protein [Actinomycetota bacterium]